MKTFFRNMSSRLLALLAALALAFAQGGAQAQPAYSYSQQNLDQMLAPIALYPDALLSQILMAATYPLEVVEAARWARARPGLAGDDAVRAAEIEDWDPAVKSLVAFPQVLARMDENLQWTQSLGDAFLDQQEQVMDTVQALRRKAQAAGNLRSDERLSVVESGPRLLLQPANPQVVYVPYYDPLVVYGSWWWPAYPPVYWRPWPGYYARPAYAGGFYWGSPIGVSAGFFFGTIDWRQRQVRVVHVNNYYYNPTTLRHAHASPPPGVRRPGIWHHDSDRRRGIAYGGVDAHRFDRGADAHPNARFEARRPDPLPAMGTRANVEPAPAAPLAQPAAAVKPAPTDIRFDHRRETRGPAQPAQPAAAIPVMRPVPVMQAVPVAQAAPAARGDRHAARVEPGARIEAPRAAQPRMDVHPAQSAVRHEPAPTAAARHEPAARHHAQQASPPRADSRPPPAEARQESGAKANARRKMDP